MFNIQEASLKDSENILELEKEIWKEYVTTKWDMATFIRFGQVLVVYENEKLIAALIAIFTKNDELFIVDLIVDFRYRRKGIATKLYEYLFKMFDKKIIADISMKHKESLILHETLGFVQLNSDSNWYGLNEEDENRLIYQKFRTTNLTTYKEEDNFYD